LEVRLADLQANPAAEAGQGTDIAPKYITSEDLNRAISKRLGEFSAKQEKAFTDLASGLGSKLDALVANPAPARDSAAAGKGESPAGSVEDHPLVKGLQKRLSELETSTKAAHESAAAEKAKSRDAEMRRRLSDSLASHGVDSARMKHAIGYLVDAQKMVRLSEDGETIVFKDESDGDLDLATGLKAWVKTDDGKLYIPPRGAQGSGDRGGATPAKSNDPNVTRENAASLLLSHLTGGAKQ
jgi:hypothetical protein